MKKLAILLLLTVGLSASTSIWDNMTTVTSFQGYIVKKFIDGYNVCYVLAYPGTGGAHNVSAMSCTRNL